MNVLPAALIHGQSQPRKRRLSLVYGQDQPVGW